MIGYLTPQGETYCDECVDPKEGVDLLDTPGRVRVLELELLTMQTELDLLYGLEAVTDRATLLDLSAAVWCGRCGNRIDGTRRGNVTVT